MVRWWRCDYDGLSIFLRDHQLICVEIHERSVVTLRATNDSHLPVDLFREAEDRSSKLVVSEYRAEDTISKMHPDLMFKTSQWLHFQQGAGRSSAQHSIVSPS